MNESFLKPDYQIFAAKLKSCAAISNIKLGKSLHSHVLKMGIHSFLLVSKALLNMYAKCMALEDCHQLFSRITHPDAVTWNIMLSGFAGTRVDDAEVIKLFNAMNMREYLRPSSVTVAVVLPACVRLRGLKLGKSVHSYAIKSGLESQTLVGNALISLYAKFGCVFGDACQVFDEVAERDVVSWNAMIAGLQENGLFVEAFGMFQQMIKEGAWPNYATIANILSVCSLLEGNAVYQVGKKIHGYALRRTELMADVSVVNALVGFYSKIGRMGEAESLFQTMDSRDLVSWNSMIAGYTSNGEWLKALELFCKFNYLGFVEPDSVTFLTILPACAYSQNLRAGKQIHGYIIHRPTLAENTEVGNSLVSFYSKCSDLASAFLSFSLICKRDLISWNSILDAYSENRLVTEFVEKFHCMLNEGIEPDSITIVTAIQLCADFLLVGKVKEAHGFSLRSNLLHGTTEPTLGNALINAYSKCENLEYALRIFQSLSGKRNVVTCNSQMSEYINSGSPDYANTKFKTMLDKGVTTWNLMVRAYAENAYPDQALYLFQELQKHGKKPDTMTIMSIFPVSVQMSSVEMLRQCHSYVVRACFEEIQLKAALLDAYSKCGSISSACKLFKSVHHKDLVTFTSMVGGYAIHGMGEEALAVYFHMLDIGIKPDHVIITSVLSACSHAGLVDEGLKIFYSLEKVHGIKPTMEQYACVVDLLARRGRINDAYSFITSMAIEPNADIWTTLLGGCRNHHELDMGCVVADHISEIEVTDMGNYVVMSNIYAAKAKWEDVLEIRRLVKTKDLKKHAGCSSIEVDGRKNVFIAGDTSHPLRPSIVNTLCNLDKLVKERLWW